MKKTIILIGIIGLICICGLFLFVNHASGVTLNCYTDLIYSEKDDVAIYNYDKDYSKCRNAAVGNDFSPGAETVIGQTLDSGWYSTFRLFEWFDTSSIPDTAVITGWYFYFASSYTYGMMDYIDIIDGSSFELPPVLEDYNISGYNLTVGGELSGYLAFFEPDTYLVIGSNVDGVGFINKTGMTKFVLMSHNDFDGIPDYSDNRGFIYMNEGSYPPILVVYYTLDYVECGSTDLTVISNLVNCTVTNQSSYNSATGWTTWINGTSPLAWFFNIANMTITHENSWDGANQNLYVNGTGNTTALTLFENFINAYGTHEYNLGPGGLSVWANVTGTGSGSIGPVLLVDDPNPANNTFADLNITFENPGFINNNISVNSAFGLKTSVDVKYQNFIEQLFVANHTTIQGWISYTEKKYAIQYGEPVSESFTIGFNDHSDDNFENIQFLVNSFVVRLVGLQFEGFTGNVFDMNYKIETALGDVPTGTILSEGTFNISDIPMDGETPGKLYTIYLSEPILVEPDAQYAIVLEPVGLTWEHNYLVEWITEQPYDGGRGGYLSMWIEEEGWISIDSPPAIGCYYVSGYRGNWSNIVNLTYLWSPDNIDWYQHDFQYAAQNGTYCVLNANFTNASTQYWWSVTPEINSTVYPEQFYTFTTGTNTGSQLIPLQSADYRYGLLVGAVGLIAFSFRKKKKEENRKKK